MENKDNPKDFVRKVTITNELGLHARSAAKIAKIALRAAGKIWIMKDALTVDAASIIDILTLEGTKGSDITIKIEDRSDAEILTELEQLVASGFGE
ncbi:MAG: HPr family phosphocarrier protein [Thermodesulfobacteriota bacterium]